MWLTPALGASFPNDENGLVILNYHRIGEDHHPLTNITATQFESHIQELMTGDYNILVLGEALNILQSGDALPPRSISLTFDGGYKSFLNNALPVLEKYNLPFTLFIAPSTLSDESEEYLSWADVTQIEKSKLSSIGLHSAAYDRVHYSDETEIRKNINSALGQARKYLQKTPTLFAYPFGEYNERYTQIVKESGFIAALTQHAGPAHSNSDPFALPRFIFTENYADMERFKMIVNALPLRITDMQPTQPILTKDNKTIGFTLPLSLISKKESLSCYLSGIGKIEPTYITESRAQIMLEASDLPDRARLNCTLPDHKNDDGDMIWRWFGYLMSVEN